MDNKQIKKALKDVRLYAIDAEKAWPKHPEVVIKRLDGAMFIINEIYDYVERPMGDEGEQNG